MGAEATGELFTVPPAIRATNLLWLNKRIRDESSVENT